MIKAMDPSLKPKLLITGAGGLLGHALCRETGGRWQVYGTYLHNKPQGISGAWSRLDLTDHKAFKKYLQKILPDAVIHAAAMARATVCHDNPEETETINVTVPTNLATWCAASGVPMAFTSTDLVFDGQNPPYKETDPPNPLNEYGRQKARAEAAVLAQWPEALVHRLPLMVGLGPFAGDNFTAHMLQAIAGNQTVTLYEDEFRTPVDIWSAARGILQFIGCRKGLLHLGGRKRVSRLDIGIMAARAMGVAPTMIKPVRSRELPTAEGRAQDCSLDSELAFNSGYNPLDIETAIRRTVAHLRGSPDKSSDNSSGNSLEGPDYDSHDGSDEFRSPPISGILR